MTYFNGWGACCCGGSTCTCSATICVTQCPGGTELVGATVSVKQGATTIGTGTTVDDGAGHACVSICLDSGGGAGSYQVIITATGYQGYTGTLSLACNGTTTIELQPSTAPATVTFSVTGCCGAAVSGATITLSDGQSCTTNSSGQCSFWIGAAGTYTYTVSKSRFVDATGSVTVAASCQGTTTSVGVAMTAASGYACPPYDPSGHALADPIPTTLHLTDSAYGGCTLTWDPTPGNLWWHGQLTASFAAHCNCPAASFTIDYYLLSCTAGSGSYVLKLDWSSGDYGQCLSGSFFGVQVGCPTATTPGCAGQPEGAYVYQPTGAVTELRWIGAGYSLVSALPFDATFTEAALSRCPSASGYDPDLIYPSGTTITITE